MKKFLKKAAITACAAAAILCAACSNYRLAGTPIDLPFRSVYVQPVRNFSYAPQASNLLTNAISDAVSQTPQVRVANKSEADAVLETEIVDYKKIPYASRETDTALAAAYKITATAQCTLSTGGRVIFKDRKVQASVIVYDGNGGFLNSEYQNMPVLMRELGAKVRDAVIGIW